MSMFPKLVMIIRHGEKPGSPDGTDGGVDLSILGSARAAALPSLFTPGTAKGATGTPQQVTCGTSPAQSGQYMGTYGAVKVLTTPPRFPVPNFLFATAQPTSQQEPSNKGSDSESSNRPYETVVPLSEALPGAPVYINNTFANDDYKGVAEEILKVNPAKYAEQVVLIAWHHGKIPDLVTHFKVPDTELQKIGFSKWPSTVFDVVLLITWPNGVPTLNIGYQQSLFGDTTAPADGPEKMQEPYRTFPSVLIFDNRNQLPVQFRDTSLAHATTSFSMVGLAELRASGSSQYDLPQLEALLGRIQTKKGMPVYLVDLRQESHVFLNGKDVSWYADKDWANVGRSLAWIEEDERLKLIRLVAARTAMVGTLVKSSSGEVSMSDPVAVEITDATTESGLATQLNVEYRRIPVPDHCRPADDMVQDFVTFAYTLPDQAWVHFHCHGGDGRTTTFLALYDMIRNASQVTLDDIVARQSMLGQYKLFGGDGSGWKANVEAVRTRFIEDFYQYAKLGYPRMSWLEWVSRNGTQAAVESASA
jgi:hypothetical protein